MGFWPKSRQSLVRSFLNAFRGLRFALEGRNFVVTIGIGMFVLILSYVFNLDTEDRFIIIISTGTILGAEIFNTAIEKLLDHLSPAEHPEVGKIKDLLAAGVLVFSAIAVVIWTRLFLKAVLGWSV
jgi:diacylglycerol kinase (ATP)